MENVYYIIVRQEKDGGRRYVYEISRNSVYLETDYTQALRFKNINTAKSMSMELDERKDKESTYKYIVVEVKTTVCDVVTNAQ